MAKSRYVLEPGQILTVTPVADVQVYRDGDPAGGFLTEPTTFGPFTRPREMYVDGSFTAAVADYDPENMRGTFVANGVTPVTIANPNVRLSDRIIISLNTIGGTVGASPPQVDTITASVGFTSKALAGDTSIYNYSIVRS